MVCDEEAREVSGRGSDEPLCPPAEGGPTLGPSHWARGVWVTHSVPLRAARRQQRGLVTQRATERILNCLTRSAKVRLLSVRVMLSCV
jgi:hypothetical protein